MFALTSYFWAYMTLFRFYWVAFIVCLLVALTGLFFGRLRANKLLTNLIPLGLFGSYLLLSSTWAEHPTSTIEHCGLLAILIIVWIAAYILAYNCSLQSLAFVFTSIPIFIGIFLIFSFTVYGTIRVQTSAEADLGAISNTVALYLVAAVPLLLWKLRIDRVKTVALLYLIAAMVMIVLTESRAGMVGMTFSLFVTPMVMYSDKVRALKSAFIVAVLCLIALGGLTATKSGGEFVDAAFERFSEKTKLDIPSAESDLRARKSERVDWVRRLQYFYSLQAFKSHPLLGVGFMNTAPAMESKYGIYVSSHGIVTTLLGELGLCGTLLFLWLIGSSFRGFGRAISIAGSEDERSFYRACFATLLTLLFIGLFIQLQENQLFYIILAYGPALAVRSARLASTRILA